MLSTSNVVYYRKFSSDAVTQVLGQERAISSIMMLLITAQECVSGDSMQLIRLDVAVSMMLSLHVAIYYCISMLSISGLSFN